MKAINTDYKQVYWVWQDVTEFFSMDYRGCVLLPACPGDVPLANIRRVEIRCSDDDYTRRVNGCVLL